jgi:hypothetical protein
MGKEVRMDTKRKRVVGGVLVTCMVAGGAGLALAAGGDVDHEAPLAGTDLEHATRVALERTGGGTVIESEVGDDGAAYSVEVRLDDGQVMEVSLDERFRVIGTESDEDGAHGSSDEGGS